MAGAATPPKAPAMQQPPAHKMMNRRPRGVRGDRPASSDKPSGLLQEGGRVSRWKGRRPGMASRAWSGLPGARRAVWEETRQSVGSGPHTASPRVDLYQVSILRRLFQLYPCALVSGVFRPTVPSCSSPWLQAVLSEHREDPRRKKIQRLKKILLHSTARYKPGVKTVPEVTQQELSPPSAKLRCAGNCFYLPPRTFYC